MVVILYEWGGGGQNRKQSSPYGAEMRQKVVFTETF